MNFDVLSTRLINKDKKVVVFLAKKIITMDEKRPSARAVAVQDGIIVGVGCFHKITKLLELLKIPFEVNESFKDNFIYPGFSEHHMHPQVLGANLMNSHYIGYNDRVDDKSNILPGIKDPKKLIQRLKELFKEDEAKLKSKELQWFNCWGLDPLLLDNFEFHRDLLDEVSKDYPICLVHASGHVININSKAIELCGYDELHEDPNLPRFKDGRVTGTICEPPMMGYAFKQGAAQVDYSVKALVKASEIATKIARIRGCTSITDKGTNIVLLPGDNSSKAWIQADDEKKLKTRVNMEVWYSTTEVWEYAGKKGWDAIKALKDEQRKGLSIGNLKLLTDGSIQGFTAYMLDNQPYVTPNKPNGVLQMSKEQVKEQINIAESHGMSASIHTNGNGATEVCVQAIEEIREKSPNPGFRHSLEHNQLATENQFARMKKAGITTNLFANHIYFWGEVHAKYTVGEHLARRMDACKSALNHGLIFGIHSDDMVTEVSPLFSAWCAANRLTLKGRVLGFDQCLSVDEAMRVITYNHAHLAHQEDVRGSIELGKWADFTVLEEEACEENKHRLKDIKIIGSVIGGDDIFINKN